MSHILTGGYRPQRERGGAISSAASSVLKVDGFFGSLYSREDEKTLSKTLPAFPQMETKYKKHIPDRQSNP
jgi:hypothetical protein